MRIAALPPLLQQTLLATLAKADDAFASAAAATDKQGAAMLPATVPPATQPPTSVQMLVALAAAEPIVERRRKLAATADRGLSLLERLHAELAVGTPDPERLRELAEWSENLDTPPDPTLASLQRDIELRVRVEIARYERRV